MVEADFGFLCAESVFDEDASYFEAFGMSLEMSFDGIPHKPASHVRFCSIAYKCVAVNLESYVQICAQKA